MGELIADGLVIDKVAQFYDQKDRINRKIFALKAAGLFFSGLLLLLPSPPL